jgi:levanbiose-producing levanase
MTHLEFNPTARNIFLDRGRCGPIPKEGDAWKTRRSVQSNFPSSLSVCIFLDVGSIEIFLNNGEATMSALLSAPLDATALRLTATGGQVGVSNVKISK